MYMEKAYLLGIWYIYSKEPDTEEHKENVKIALTS